MSQKFLVRCHSPRTPTRYMYLKRDIRTKNAGSWWTDNIDDAHEFTHCRDAVACLLIVEINFEDVDDDVYEVVPC